VDNLKNIIDYWLYLLKIYKMEHNGQADLSATISILSAVVTVSTIQPLVSLCAGVVAIISGIFAIRYYYWKTKNLKNDNK
jgi:hypothetical protein